MITEAAMFFSVVVSILAGLRVWKSFRKLGKKELFFLSLFFFGTGFGVLSVMIRMLHAYFGYSLFIDSFFMSLGGIFIPTGFFAAMIFGILMLKPQWCKQLLTIFILFVIFVFFFIFKFVFPTPIKQIPLEPYEPIKVIRTEPIYPNSIIILFPILLLIPMMIPIAVFVSYGLKIREKRKKSFLLATGFLLYLIAVVLDGAAPWLSLVFFWRLLYGISALVIYKAFKM